MKQLEHTQRIVHCRVANRTYCFDASTVENVMQGGVLTRDGSATPAQVQEENPGLVAELRYEGADVPVFRLAQLFGHDRQASAHVSREHLIVINSEHGRSAFLVDLVYRANEVKDENLIKLPRLAVSDEHPFFSGVANLEGNTSTKLESNLLNSLIDAEAEAEKSRPDRRRASVARRAALIVSPPGVLGFSDASRLRLSVPEDDYASLLGHATHRAPQLMLFDISQWVSASRRTAIALSVTQVLEVMKADELVTVPGGPERLVGLFPWRSQFVPIVDVSLQLGLAPIPDRAKQRIVVARTVDKELIGFYATDDIRTLRLPIESSPYEDPDNVVPADRIRGSFKTQDSVFYLPCLETIAN